MRQVRGLRAFGVAGVLLAAPFAVLVASAPSASAGYGGCSTSISSSVLVPGQSATIVADGNCFDPSATVTIAACGVQLGTFTANSSGGLTATVTIPASCPLGPATITLTGPNVIGGRVTYSIPVTIVASVSASTTNGSLAFTGSDERLVIALGAALMAIGLGITAAVRQRRRARTLS